MYLDRNDEENKKMYIGEENVKSFEEGLKALELTLRSNAAISSVLVKKYPRSFFKMQKQTTLACELIEKLQGLLQNIKNSDRP